MNDFVKTSTLAIMLENGLNALIKEDNFVFKVIANVGNFNVAENASQRGEAKKIINCVLVPMPSAIVPISGLNNYYLQMSLSIVAPKDYIESVSQIINSYIKNQVGKLITVDGYVGITNFDTLYVGALTQMPMVGTGSVIATNVYYQFIKGGVLANQCVFTIDGLDTLVTEWSVGKSRISQSDNVQNSEVMYSVIAQQGLQIAVSMPYVRNSACESLFNEMWNGKLNVAHTISFYDGAIATAENPIKKHMIMLTGAVSGVAGDVPLFQFTFTEAYK